MGFFYFKQTALQGPHIWLQVKMKVGRREKLQGGWAEGETINVKQTAKVEIFWACK